MKIRVTIKAPTSAGLEALAEGAESMAKSFRSAGNNDAAEAAEALADAMQEAEMLSDDALDPVPGPDQPPPLDEEDLRRLANLCRDASYAAKEPEARAHHLKLALKCDRLRWSMGQ